MSDAPPRHSLNPNMATGLSGWAVDPQRLDQPVELAVSVDGRPVAAFLATRPRNGVKRLYGGDGRHGFSTTLPLALYDGATRRLRVERTDTGEALFDAETAFADLRWSDTVSGTMRAVARGLEGWVVDQAEPDRPCDVELWMDGKPLGVLRADADVDALPYPRGPERAHGFGLAWPPEALDGAEHRFEARLAGSSQAGVVVAVRPDPAAGLAWRGRLTVSDGRLSGVLSADGGSGLAARLDLFSGTQALQSLWVRAGERIDANLFGDVPDLTVAGALVVRIHGQALPVEGPDPLATWLTIVGATVEAEGGLTLDLSAPETMPHSVEVRWTVDDQQAAAASLSMVEARGRLALAPPAGWRRLTLSLADGSVLALVTSEAGAQDAAPVWRDPTARDAVQGRALAAAGLRLDGAEGVTGDWRLDRDAGRVEGWALNLADPEALIQTDLLVDGAIAASLSVAGGFAFDLADAPIQAPFSTVAVRIGPQSAPPERSEHFAPSGCGGEATQALWQDFQLTVRGWALDFSQPARPLSVSLWFVDKPLAHALTEPMGSPPGVFILACAMGPAAMGDALTLRIDDGPSLALPPVERPADAAEPLAETSATDLMAGRLERIGDALAEGWMANAVNPEAAPEPILWLDETPLGPPIALVPTDSEGAAGARRFVFALPPDLAPEDLARLAVRPRIGRGQAKPAADRLKGRSADLAVSDQALDRRAPDVGQAMAPVTVIVINPADGRSVDRLMDSALRHEDADHVWRIVDGRGDPATAEACRGAAARGLDVSCTACAAHQVASTVRRVAEAALTEDLILIDAAASWVEPVIDRLAGALVAPGVGLAGATARQALGGAQPWTMAGQRVAAAPRMVKAPLYGLIGSPPEAQAVWTVAPGPGPVAVRRDVFVAAGGLDEATPAGDQINDLALRLAEQGLRTVTLPVVIDLELASAAPKDRRSTPLAARWDGPLREVLRADPMASGVWTGARPVVGLIVDETKADQTAAAADLASRLIALGPARVKQVARQAWGELGEIDLAIVLDDSFRPEAATTARPHLRLIRWLRRPDETTQQARAFDTLWTTDASQAARLAEQWPGVDARSFAAGDLASLLRPGPGLRIAIKTPARKGHEAHWGDFHFANSLAEALAALGHRVRVDVREDWRGPLAATDNVVIVLRGLAVYQPQPHQVNLLWIISHPEAIPAAELARYDHVFVASEPYAETLAALTNRSVEPLLQCTDPARFNPQVETPGMPRESLVFVGNARGVFRPAVQWALESGLELALYGRGWEGLVPDDQVHGVYVPNEILASLYRAGDLVLCDHWDDMRRLGFISNRVFDVLACGAVLATDAVEGLDAAFGPHAPAVVGSAADLRAAAANSATARQAAQAAAEWVLQHHTFAHRARRLVDAARACLTQRPSLAARLSL